MIIQSYIRASNWFYWICALFTINDVMTVQIRTYSWLILYRLNRVEMAANISSGKMSPAMPNTHIFVWYIRIKSFCPKRTNWSARCDMAMQWNLNDNVIGSDYKSIFASSCNNNFRLVLAWLYCGWFFFYWFIEYFFFGFKVSYPFISLYSFSICLISRDISGYIRWVVCGGRYACWR